ncbi:hypothetical protein D1007_31961 [Hordeum vulgare]|nr:hypothetical protein D1007_31961 [Hordeum vulgare]
MVSCCYLVIFECFMYLLYLFWTNLLIQCQVSVPVFSVFLTLFRSDFGTKSKRNKIPERIFFRTEEDQGVCGPSQEGYREPTSPHSATRGAAGDRLVASLAPPDLDLASIYSLKIRKSQGIHDNTFPPPQTSVSARSHLEALPGALPEGTLELEGFFIIIIAPPMTRE